MRFSFALLSNLFVCGLFLVGPFLSGLFFAGVAFAEGAPPASPQMTPITFILGTVNFFLFGFLVYFIVYLRPQQQREEEHKKFLAALKTNDEILTRGGVMGKVSAIKEGQITIEVANGVKLRVHPSYVLSAPTK